MDRIEVNIQKGRNTEIYKGILFFQYLKIFMTELYRYQKTDINEKETIKRYQQNLCNSIYKHIDIARFYSESPIHNSEKSEKDLIIYLYKFVFDKFFGQLGHYFRHLYHIFKFIKDSEETIIKFRDLNFYIGLIQAKLSSSELFLLFYDGILFPKMGDIINYFCPLENLSKEDLLNTEHEKLYQCKMKTRGT